MKQAASSPPATNPQDTAFTRELARNRQEDRTVDVFTVGDALARTDWQPLIKTIIRVSRRTVLLRIPAPLPRHPAIAAARAGMTSASIKLRGVKLQECARDRKILRQNWKLRVLRSHGSTAASLLAAVCVGPKETNRSYPQRSLRSRLENQTIAERLADAPLKAHSAS